MSGAETPQSFATNDPACLELPEKRKRKRKHHTSDSSSEDAYEPESSSDGILFYSL